MKLPDWYGILLLGAAAWRTFQLVSNDDILDRPRNWLLGLKEWSPGQKVPETYREKWGEWITCPYCAGAWVAVAWWVAFQISPRATYIVATPFAISMLVIAQAKILSRDE